MGIIHIKTVCTQTALTSKERQKQCHIGDHVTTSPPPWRPIPQWLPDQPPPQSYTDLSHPRRPWWGPLCPRKCQLSPAYPKVTKCNQQSERPTFLLSLVLIEPLAGLKTLQALPILSSFDVRDAARYQSYSFVNTVQKGGGLTQI